MLSEPSVTPDTFVSFGALLRFLRVRARLSQRELSIAIGYSEAHLSRLEAGQRRPDRDVVRARLLPALGLAADEPLAARLLTLAKAQGTPQESGAPPTAPSSEQATPHFGNLLATKLARPPVRHGAIERPSLVARLAAAREAPLTLVTAPPGFGKTTLVSQWLTEAQSAKLRAQNDNPHLPAPERSNAQLLERVAWLSLDAGDNDPALFIRYLVAALQTAVQGVGEGTIALLQAVPPPLPTLLTPLLNDLAKLPHEVALVLDDYHVIETPAIHEALAFLLDRAPAHVHLIVVTRADPPLPLTRLRARGQLVEIRARDLRFDRAEAEAFLRLSMGLQLEDDAVVALEERTEGWAAGLQLAALALREQPDHARFVRNLAATSRYIADYLAEEVLDRLPTHLRSFVLQTSFLDRLNGPLCDAVLGLTEPAGGETQAYSQLVLQELERRNLFLTPLDETRQWYRYHALFAEVARARLFSGASNEERARLFRRAAAAESSREHGIEYLLAGKLWDEAGQQIVAVAEALLAGGQHRTVRRWIVAFPAEALVSLPRLAVLGGFAAARENQLAAAKHLLEQGLAGCERLADAHGQNLALTELAVLAMIEGDLERSLVRIDTALALAVPLEGRAHTLMLAIGAFNFAARTTIIIDYADELFGLLGRADAHKLYAAILPGAHSLAVSLLNRLEPLESLCRTGLATISGKVSLARVGAEVGLAHIGWLRGRFDEALALVQQARESSAHFGTYVYAEPQLLSIEGTVATAQGDLATAAECFARSLDAGRPLGLYSFAHTGQLYSLARVRWQQHRLDELRELAARAARAGAEMVPLAGAMRDLLAALVAIAESRDDEAEALLVPLAAREHEVGLMAIFGSAHALVAHLALRHGKPAAAADALAPLLVACARDGTPGRLLMEGPYIIPLLRAAMTHNVHADSAAAALDLLNEARRRQG